MEKVIDFTNFVLKYGYSNATIKKYDVLIMRAHNLKLTMYFNPPNADEKSSRNWEKKLERTATYLTRFCIKTNLLKRFKMIEPIGKGGFATVYKMKRKADGALFAVKMIKKMSLRT